MPTVAVEDCLKQVYLASQDDPVSLVPMGKLASALGVVPGTATAMVKKLARSRLLVYEPYGGVRLTPKGRSLAVAVLRRHRLIESFLVEVMGLDWSEIHAEADRLEHAISDRLLDRIDAVLGSPRVDPHGDPIPDGRGAVRRTSHLSLADCDTGRHFRIARIVDQDQSFLQFVDHHGLKPGAKVTVVRRDPAADSVVISTGKSRNITMGRAAAAKLLVESRSA